MQRDLDLELEGHQALATNPCTLGLCMHLLWICVRLVWSVSPIEELLGYLFGIWFLNSTLPPGLQAHILTIFRHNSPHCHIFGKHSVLF